MVHPEKLVPHLFMSQGVSAKSHSKDVDSLNPPVSEEYGFFVVRDNQV